MTFHSSNCTLGKKNQTFQGLLDTGSELMLVLGEPKEHFELQVKEGLMDVRRLIEF